MTGCRATVLRVAQLYRMGEVGLLEPDARVELIEGEIIDMPPPGSLHSGTVDWLNALFWGAVQGQAIVRVQGPVSPEPPLRAVA